MKLTAYRLTLPLRHPFTIAHGTTTVQENVLVTLEAGGHIGYGEAAPAKAYPQFSVPAILHDLATAQRAIESTPWETPEELWQALAPHLGHNPFAQCAVDLAAHDLWGKQQGAPLWKLWGLALENIPASNYTIGIDTIPKMIAKLHEFADWPIFKIKLGTAHDLEIVRALRRETEAIFRIDANTAWSAADTIAWAPELKDLGVEFLEQPLAADDWEGMKQIHDQCVLPVIADESCIIESDVARCAGSFDGVNVKLNKAGGLTPVRRMIAEARRHGLSVMCGCMKETSVGISAIAQLLPLLDAVDMDGAVLLARDPADGVRLERGRAIFPERAGTGVDFRDWSTASPRSDSSPGARSPSRA
jgi:L-Ala-D/L-Glu epimerase